MTDKPQVNGKHYKMSLTQLASCTAIHLNSICHKLHRSLVSLIPTENNCETGQMFGNVSTSNTQQNNLHNKS